MRPKGAESHWRELLSYACAVVDDVNRNDSILTDWTLGGGTALTLQINHRLSYDIDIFLPDPQLLGFVAASVADMEHPQAIAAIDRCS